MRELKTGLRIALLTAAAVVIAPLATAQAGTGDFTTWSQVQDPANANFTSSTTSTQATLNAGNGAVPASTDIGYQSVNGETVATSTGGFAFSKADSFSIAIDYSLSGASQQGTLGIGFGIGEDRDGMDSAGVAMLTNNGTPLAYGSAARINDANQTAHLIAVAASSVGTLFASYDASSGDITVGASGTAGASSPAGTATYSGIEHSWSGVDLLASFFLRSDGTLSTPWQGGTEQAVFSNFRILSGSAETVPEPASIALLGVGLLFARRRRQV